MYGEDNVTFFRMSLFLSEQLRGLLFRNSEPSAQARDDGQNWTVSSSYRDCKKDTSDEDRPSVTQVGGIWQAQ